MREHTIRKEEQAFNYNTAETLLPAHGDTT
jgi:hypothetical protein